MMLLKVAKITKKLQRNDIKMKSPLLSSMIAAPETGGQTIPKKEAP